MPRMKALRVLIIDDDQTVTDLLSKQLIGQGAIPQVASSFQEGVTALRQNPPDIAIVDLMLPEHSGVQLLQQLKESTKNTFFVVLTNLMNAESLLKSANLEVPLILQKADHDPAEIVRAIAEKFPS
jgi:two-component system, response regulator RegA